MRQILLTNATLLSQVSKSAEKASAGELDDGRPIHA